jgi:ATP-binding protein involved in chromosome partitioning
MSYFISDNTNNKKHYIFGKDGVKNLSDDLNLNFLGEVPLSTSIRESSDVGHPTALQENSKNSKIFYNLAKSIVNKVNYRNKNIEPSQIVKIKNMDGC